MPGTETQGSRTVWLGLGEGLDQEQRLRGGRLKEGCLGSGDTGKGRKAPTKEVNEFELRQG